MDPAWTRRVKITSKSAQIPAAFGHCLLFDCGANLAGVTDFWSNIKSDGSDLRVTKADGVTEVARGVRGFNVGSQAGRIHLRHPDISTSADVDLYLYFGNAAAADYADNDALGFEGTWAGESAIELHYTCDSEDITGTSLEDRSGNARNGTLVNQAAGNAAGKIGGGIIFDGTGDTITRANASNIIIPASNAAWSILLWVNLDEISGATTMRSIMSNESAGASGIRFSIDGGSWIAARAIRFDTSESGGTISCAPSSPLITLDTWTQLCGSYTGSAATLYKDGSSIATDASGSIISNTNTITFGGGIGGHRQWLGMMDQIRMFSRALSANEVATIYNNENANASFWDAGAVELTEPAYAMSDYRFYADDGVGLGGPPP